MTSTHEAFVCPPGAAEHISKLVGARIRKMRHQHGTTQADLATLVGVSRAAISDYEVGRNSPSLAVLAEIATVFKVSPAVLLMDMPD